jgi:membrane fusion protein (multidrug efflux system)
MNTIVLAIRRPFTFVIRRPITTFLLFVLISGGAVVGMSKLGVDLPPPLNTPRVHAAVAFVSTGAWRVKDYAAQKYMSIFHGHNEEHHEEPPRIVVTSPLVKDLTLILRYVCQIHSKAHIKVRAIEDGYLQEILVREGQAVQKGDVMFRILPVLYQARLDAEVAEADVARIKYENTRKLSERTPTPIVSVQEVALARAELARATAKANLARAELRFTEVTAPFDGIVDKRHENLGSLIDKGDILTTLSDNSVMWVYFNVPERAYLEYMAARKEKRPEPRIELELADFSRFDQVGVIGAIEAKFNNETGNIPFRADFPNPDRLLRHGQTGTILIHRELKDAILIPQRAIFELLDKRYVWVVDEDHVAHQRLIKVSHELEDIFVVDPPTPSAPDIGLRASDRIVLEGVRDVRDKARVEGYEFLKPEDALKNQKYHAE